MCTEEEAIHDKDDMCYCRSRHGRQPGWNQKRLIGYVRFK
jgi:hypothetical protein